MFVRVLLLFVRSSVAYPGSITQLLESRSHGFQILYGYHSEIRIVIDQIVQVNMTDHEQPGSEI